MFRIFFLILAVSILSCKKAPEVKNEPKNVDNAATRYADQLRDTKVNAQEAVDSMNQSIAETQSRYEDIDNQ